MLRPKFNNHETKEKILTVWKNLDSREITGNEFRLIFGEHRSCAKEVIEKDENFGKKYMKGRCCEGCRYEVLKAIVENDILPKKKKTNVR